MKIRILLTTIVIAFYMVFSLVYSLFESPIVGASNAQVLTDSNAAYGWSAFVASGGITHCAFYALLIALGLIWLLFKPTKNKTHMKNTTLLMAGLIASIALTGCAPVKVLDVVEIKPNETAWAIPLDGSSQSGQVKFNSVEFLNQKKVSMKRIMVDKVERKIGRMPWDIEWIPAIRVIRVDRSLVTREWTDGHDGGTSAKREGVGVVTKDSVQLRVGLTVTASIDEDDASTYLYFHGERALSDVLDQNIRSFAVAELTKEYSQLTLSEAQTRSTEIYAKLFEDAKTAFKAKGITVQYLGNAEGLEYSDPKVQEAINKSYTVQQDTKTAEMEQQAAKIRNATAIMTAEATAEAAAKTFKAKDASELQTELQIRQMEAKAKLTMAEKWNGQLPSNILPSGSPLLMSLSSTNH